MFAQVVHQDGEGAIEVLIGVLNSLESLPHRGIDDRTVPDLAAKVSVRFHLVAKSLEGHTLAWILKFELRDGVDQQSKRVVNL